MGAVPRSLVIAIRDVVVLLVIAFAVGFLLDAWATHIDDLSWWRHSVAEFADVKQRLIALGAAPDLLTPPAAPTLAWDSVAKTAAGWAARLALWAAACWVATRARAGLRTVWVPGAAAIAIVVARSVAALVPDAPGGAFLRYPELWPGPDIPVTYAGDGSLTLLAWHPGWAYPPLVVALLLTASWLGARAGRLPDDKAARRIVPTAGMGRVVAAVVIGLPAVGGAAAAVVGYLVATRDAGFTTAHSVVLELLAPLVTVVLAAALLSGTGWLGGALTFLATVPLVVGPVSAWMVLQASEVALVAAAGAALLCVAVALWRPAALWGGEILAPARTPIADEPNLLIPAQDARS